MRIWQDAATRGIAMDYTIGMAILKDTANARMRAAGRTKWSRADYNAGIDAFKKCVPLMPEHDRLRMGYVNGRFLDDAR